MPGLDDLREERLRKLTAIRARGGNPYPGEFFMDYALGEVSKNFSKFTKRKKESFILGRILGIREHGGSLFLDLYDGTGRLQVYVKKDQVGEKAYTQFIGEVDIGDFIECCGTFFLTKKGEKTLTALRARIIVKSLRPLPEKWHGLTDIEERFRRRYLDILTSSEVHDRFILRANVIDGIRNFLNEEGFLEVETPMLQEIAGGATAKPFVTHHNALSIDLFLRIAPELYLKELLVAGYTKVYELGRNFRNEGIDATHQPEFTTLEVYASYQTPATEKKRIEKLFGSLAKKIFGKKECRYDGVKISFSAPFREMTFASIMKKFVLLPEKDFENREAIILKARQHGIVIENKDSIDRILDSLYKKFCRPKIIEPTFIVDFPISFSPLAKKKEESDKLIDRFQLVAGGLELANGFAELNDPLEQRKRFLEQERRRKSGDEEAQKTNEAFIEALEYGMPPATGWAIGIDRLLMLFSDLKNIREAIIFPTLRPK